METLIQVLAGLTTVGAFVFGVLALLDTARWATRRNGIHVHSRRG